MPEESTPAENSEKEEESWETPHPLTLDEIFQELRKAREEAEQQAAEEEEYIPRAPKRPHRQEQTATATRPRPQNLEQRQPQTAWQPDSHPATPRAAAIPAAEPHSTQVVPSSPETEGVSVFTRTPAFATAATSQPTPTDSTSYTPAIDVDEIDWRKAVIASEILNRKYRL